MPKYRVEMTNGKVYHVVADRPPTEDEVMAFVKGQEKPGMWNEADAISAKNNGTGPLADILNAPHHLMSQVGNAATRGLLHLPSNLVVGLPTLATDIAQWGFGGKDWKDTMKQDELPWGKAVGTEATDQLFSDKLGLYSRHDANDWTRYPSRVAEFGIQTAMTGGANLPAQLASAGSAVLNRFGEDIAPDNPYVSTVLGLLGLTAGGIPKSGPKATTSIPKEELAQRVMDGWKVSQPSESGGVPRGPKAPWRPRAKPESQPELPLGPGMEQQLQLPLQQGQKPLSAPNYVQGELPFPEQQLPLALKDPVPEVPEPAAPAPKRVARGGKKKKAVAPSAPVEPVQGLMDLLRPMPREQSSFDFRFPEKAPQGVQPDLGFPEIPQKPYIQGKLDLQGGKSNFNVDPAPPPEPQIAPPDASQSILTLDKAAKAEKTLGLMKAVENLPARAESAAKMDKNTTIAQQWKGLLEAIKPEDAKSPVAQQIMKIISMLPKETSIYAKALEGAGHMFLHSKGLGKVSTAIKFTKGLIKGLEKPGEEQLAAEMQKLQDLISVRDEPGLPKPKTKSMVPAVIPAVTH